VLGPLALRAYLDGHAHVLDDCDFERAARLACDCIEDAVRFSARTGVVNCGLDEFQYMETALTFREHFSRDFWRDVRDAFDGALFTTGCGLAKYKLPDVSRANVNRVAVQPEA
jgi:hypothetical protein